MFLYRMYDLIERTWIRDLPLTNVEFNDATDATVEAKLTARLHVGDDVDQDMLNLWDRALIEHRTWCLVVHPRTGQIMWDGILLDRPWSIAEQSFELEFAASRWILFQRYQQNTKSAITLTDDKFGIARALLIKLDNNRNGTPKIVLGSETSGVSGKLRLEAFQFRYTSDVLAELSAGRKGFEWDLRAQWSPNDGLPELRFFTYYPELKYSARISLRYDRDGTGNIIAMPSTWPRGARGTRTRVYALGSGTDQNQTVAADTDAGVAGTNFTKLLTEKTTSYSGTNDKKTLWQNAYAERIALRANAGTVEVGVSLDNPDITTYWKGIRARLQVNDRYLKIDKPNVRVIEIRVHDEDRDRLADVTLVLDLNDYKLPDGADA